MTGRRGDPPATREAAVELATLPPPHHRQLRHLRRQCDRVNLHLRKPAQEPPEDKLVFLGGIGAGTVDEKAAGPEQAHRPGEQALLLVRHLRDLPFTPVGEGGVVRAPQAALRGTGRVHENAVVATGVPKEPAVLPDDLHLLRPEAAQDLAQPVSPVADHLHGSHPGGLAGMSREVRGLAPGSRAQVEHPVPGPRIQREDGEKAGPVLQVAPPLPQEGMRTHFFRGPSGRQDERLLAPGKKRTPEKFLRLPGSPS